MYPVAACSLSKHARVSCGRAVSPLESLSARKWNGLEEVSSKVSLFSILAHYLRADYTVKGIIEKSCIDGQKTYHAELEKGMRDYIHNHQSEFIPEGVDPAVVEEAEAQVAAESPGTPALDVNEEQARKVREKERNQRGLQWAYDTFEGAMKVAKQSTEGALELIKDAWDQSSSSTIQYFVIVLLVISNIWTLTTMGRQEEVGRRKEIRRTEDREKWVQGVVTALWDELTNTKAEVIDLPVPSLAVLRASTNDVKAEVAELNNVLDKVEERVRIIRGSLQDLD